LLDKDTSTGTEGQAQGERDKHGDRDTSTGAERQAQGRSQKQIRGGVSINIWRISCLPGLGRERLWNMRPGVDHRNLNR